MVVDSNNRPTYESLAPDARRDLFDRILSRCDEKGRVRPAVVVFDLDGTLMDNRPRTIAILRELGHSWKARAPHHHERLVGATPESLSYLVKESLASIGVVEPELVTEAEQFWKDRFFTDDALVHDVALPGAVGFARGCYERGAMLVYFTGRDLPLMGTGSFRSLKDLGFPIGVVGAELVLKPEFNIPDEEFKRKEVKRIERLGEIVAAFDNEPGNCNIFAEGHPGAESVFVDTQHLPGAPKLHPSVKIIPDFTVE
jgi:hypothetical protein